VAKLSTVESLRQTVIARLKLNKVNLFARHSGDRRSQSSRHPNQMMNFSSKYDSSLSYTHWQISTTATQMQPKFNMAAAKPEVVLAQNLRVVAACCCATRHDFWMVESFRITDKI